MALHIARDDARQRLVVTGAGDISVSDLRVCVDQQHDAGIWHYALLYDFSAATIAATGAEMQLLASHTEGLRPPKRGPVAVIAMDDTFYGMARMYSLLTESSGLRFQVFRDRQSAEHWLEEHQRLGG